MGQRAAWVEGGGGVKFPAFIPTHAYCEINDDDDNWVRIDLDFDPIAKADIDSFDHKNIVIFTQGFYNIGKSMKSEAHICYNCP